MVVVAARYGHQPVSEVRAMTLDELIKFNDALGELIQDENKSGRSHMNKFAEGGG